MLFVREQSEENVYMICYYHLHYDKEHNVWLMIGYDEKSKQLINLGVYNFYRQAIQVFAEMDYKENDLMYYKKTPKWYCMPPNITDEKECISVYGSTY